MQVTNIFSFYKIISTLAKTIVQLCITFTSSSKNVFNSQERCPGTTRQASVTLTFDLPEWNLQMAHLLIVALMENNCAKLVGYLSINIKLMLSMHTCMNAHTYIEVNKY